MSRRPNPSAINELRGNPGGRPVNTEEPKPPKGIPEMPKGMRPSAQREWRRMTVFLDSLGVLTVIDGKALAMYCDAYSDWEVAQKKCVTSGMWYDEPVLNKEGDVVGWKHKQAPWFNIKCANMKMMKSFLIEFGMTPASRAKLKIDKVKPSSEEEGLLSRDAAALKQPNDEPDLDAIDLSRVN